MLEFWEDWKWSASLDPIEHALTFVIGWGIGLFLGGSIMWWALP